MNEIFIVEIFNATNHLEKENIFWLEETWRPAGEVLGAACPTLMSKKHHEVSIVTANHHAKSHWRGHLDNGVILPLVLYYQNPSGFCFLEQIEAFVI